ncbi:hypothetical protein [Psychrobacter sp. I-STPA10]|uniref:hypothetical protein n=1 Tax=Psychrobacter sp. I-STPA10 TaxID=2585769 RepID=UPI001E4ADB84|nr:hypothetical protein [Psychrobacter sp. I-STPA10]
MKINKLLWVGLLLATQSISQICQADIAKPTKNTSNISMANATPISFATGNITHVITDKLARNQDEHWYQFNAQQGQYAIINISHSQAQGITETANVGVLYFPNGEQDGTKGGIIYQGCLPESGKYHLRIARNLMATHGGVAGYRVEMVILPRYASRTLCP